MGDKWRHTKDFVAGRMSAEAMMERLRRDLPGLHPGDRERVYAETRNTIAVYFEEHHRKEVPKAFEQEFKNVARDIKRWELLDEAKRGLAQAGGPMTKERFDKYLERGREYHSVLHGKDVQKDGPGRLERLRNMVALGVAAHEAVTREKAPRAAGKRMEPSAEQSIGA